MAGYSYFLPHLLRCTADYDDYDCNGIKVLHPVYTAKLDFYDMQMVVTGFGRVFFLGYGNLNGYHRSIHFSNNELCTSEDKSLEIDELNYLNSVGDVISINTKSDKSICISYKRASHPNNLVVLGELDYEYSIKHYIPFLSGGTKIAILTTNTLSENDCYVDILSCQITNELVKLFHSERIKLPHRCFHLENQLQLDLTLYFSVCETKLFIISQKSNYPIVAVAAYSLSDEAFGLVYKSDRSFLNCSSYYAYHKDIGNMLIFCKMDGVLKTLREVDLHFSQLRGGDVDLKEYLPHYLSFEVMHLDYFDKIVIFLRALANNDEDVLFLFDYFGRRVIGKFMASDCRFIANVKTSWSGEEIFVLVGREDPTSSFDDETDSDGDDMPNLELNILISKDNNNVSSLKHLSKLALFKSFSVENLKEMDFPKMLKKEMKLII